jgi:hypothetical protein
MFHIASCVWDGKFGTCTIAGEFHLHLLVTKNIKRNLPNGILHKTPSRPAFRGTFTFEQHQF